MLFLQMIKSINGNKIKYFTKNNKWTILASIFFVAWSFFLINTLWHNRLSPPEPDDSYIYITHIESVKKCPSLFFCKNPIYSLNGFGFYSHFTYRAFFGYLALLLNITSFQVYHLSFYIGSVFLLVTFIILLKSLDASDKLTAISLLFLVSNGGGGSIHNFSWVIPQLFSLMLFLLLISIILKSQKKWKFMIPLLIIFGIFMHTISIYYFMILTLFIFLFSIFNRKIDKFIIKKTAFAILIAAITYFSLSIYLQYVAKGNPYGIENFLNQSIENIKANIENEQKLENKEEAAKQNIKVVGNENINKNKGGNLFPGFEKIYNNYLKWLFLNPIGIFSFSVFSFILIFYRQKLILSIYLAAFLFTLIASINQYGSRSLSFLVPITFIFYAYGFFYLYKFFSEIIKKQLLKNILKFSVIFSGIIFLISTLLFSYFWNLYLNERDNLYLPPEFSQYIKNNLPAKEKIYYNSKILESLNNMGDLRSIRRTRDAEDAYFYVIIEHERKKFEETRLDSFLNFLSKIIHVSRQKGDSVKIFDSNFAKLKYKFSLIQEFGDIKIYKKITNN